MSSTWRNDWRCTPFLTTLGTYTLSIDRPFIVQDYRNKIYPFIVLTETKSNLFLQKQNLLVEVVPSPQLAVHIHQPRRCLRGCRPLVTRKPSRVQATARSNTRALRRRPPGLTRAESACSRQMGREWEHLPAPAPKVPTPAHQEHMQGVRGCEHLPAPAPKEQMQGVRGREHLPAPAPKEQMQGVPRGGSLRMADRPVNHEANRGSLPRGWKGSSRHKTLDSLVVRCHIGE